MLRGYDDMNDKVVDVEKVMDLLGKLKERIDGLHEALKYLVVQVQKSNAVDAHGHELKNLHALHEAQALLKQEEKLREQNERTSSGPYGWRR